MIIRLALCAVLALTGTGAVMTTGARVPDGALPLSSTREVVPAAKEPAQDVVAGEAGDVVVTEVEVVVPAVDDGGAVVASPQVREGRSDPDVLVADEVTDSAGGQDRVVSEVLETDGFQTLGVTWPVDAEVGQLEAQVRTRTGGAWSDWQGLEQADDGPDTGSADAAGDGRGGTDALWVGQAEAVQVSFPAEASAGPEDLSLTLIDVPEPTEPAEAAGAVTSGVAAVQDAVYLTGSVATATSPPAIITRAQWGAAAQVCTPDVAARLVGAVVHHTAGSNGYSTVAQAMQQIRGDQAYHINGRRWCDLGYNFVVDKWGNIYEGRANSMSQPVIGVHAGGFNTGTVGVSMLGTYDAPPSAATQQAVAQIIGWRLGAYGVDPATTMAYFTYGGENSRIPANTMITLPRVIGHRDVANTACPGTGGYAALPWIRATASTLSFDARYVQATALVKAMYADLLGRAPDPGGLVSWSGMVAAGTGGPALVASLTSSEEYVRLRITQAYQSVVGRAPDAGGMAYWYDRIRSGSATVDDVARRFYDSDEYLQRAGGTAEGYISLLYQTMFERSAAPSETAYWSATIATTSRGEVVDAIWYSFEAALYRSGGYYRTFLQREPDAGGQVSWAGVLLSSGEGAVRIGIAGSEEYRQLAQRRFG